MPDSTQLNFDDLVPQQQQPSLSFDDLVPAAPQDSGISALTAYGQQQGPDIAPRLATGPEWAQKSARGVQRALASQIPTSAAPDLTSMLPLPIQMGLQGAQLGAEGARVSQLPLGSQEQYDWAAQAGLALAPALLPFAEVAGLKMPFRAGVEAPEIVRQPSEVA